MARAVCHRLAASSSGPSPSLLAQWRTTARSYRSLCRFLHGAAPLAGVWVHQNPELGNLVVLLWGLASLVACRVIPQELSGGPLLFAPVFEILAHPVDGSPSLLFLHGHDPHDAAAGSLYPGVVRSIHPSCNVLLLEVDVRPPENPPRTTPQLLHARSLAASKTRDDASERKFRRSDTTFNRRSPVPPAASVPFSHLAFGDRRRVLELVADAVRIETPPGVVAAPLFPIGCDDGGALDRRRLSLIDMHKMGNGGWVDQRVAELQLISMPRGKDADVARTTGVAGKRRSLSSYLKEGLKQFMARSSSGRSDNGGCSLANNERKRVPLLEFLRAGDTIGLSLRAAHMKLSTYHAWPNMHVNKFALYKLRIQSPSAGREYSGLWGGTFGWPPGRHSEEKPGKALFFLLLSYEEVDGQLLLIATKILEGTHYVLHPNGSAMFIVKVDETVEEPFPLATDSDFLQVEVKHAYGGEGIATGYGFRYPGSKPGTLFVMQNGQIVFVWKESKAVLTLQKVDLEELLKRGEQVPALPPITNFAYLTKTYSNVFGGFASNSSCSVLPR